MNSDGKIEIFGGVKGQTNLMIIKEAPKNRMHKLHAKCQIPAMHMIDAKLCSHLMFQISFRNIDQQKNYHNFLGDQLELWPSKLTFTIDNVME